MLLAGRQEPLSASITILAPRYSGAPAQHTSERPQLVWSLPLTTVRIFRHHIPKHFLWLAIAEFIAFAVAVWIGAEIRFYDMPETYEEASPIAPKALAISAVLVASLGGLGLYERQPNLGRRDIALRILAGFVFSLVPLSVIFYVVPSLYLGRGAVAIGLVLALLASFVGRFLFYNVMRQEVTKRHVLVLGTGRRALEIADYLKTNRRSGVSLVGYVSMKSEEMPLVTKKVLSLNASLSDIARQCGVDEIVVAVDDRRGGLPVSEILDCRMSGIEVVDALTFFERETGEVRLAHVTPGWMIFSDGFRAGFFHDVAKRAFDLLLVLILLPVALPFMAMIVAAIKLEDGIRAPVLYSQLRVGQKRKPFRILKFRSMHVGAERGAQPQWATTADPRITRVGRVIRKIRLDELPQLFNILRGDMSIVGPRPERPEFVADLERSLPYYSERHRLKPGLTGWAQICYKYGESNEDAYRKLQYDLYYVKNQSMFLDLLIVLQTIEVVLLGKGAH